MTDTISAPTNEADALLVEAVAEATSTTPIAAESEMRRVRDAHEITYRAYVDEELFRCATPEQLASAVADYHQRQNRLAEIVASSAGWTFDRAFTRMREVEQRWPQLNFTVFVTHSLYQLTNDEIDEKAARWERPLVRRQQQAATASGRSVEDIAKDMRRREVIFGLQSKYYLGYRAWELDDEDVQHFATRRSSKALYDAVNTRPEEVDDKLAFSEKFSEFLLRKSWRNRDTSFEEFRAFCTGIDRAFCKPSDADQGRGVSVLEIPEEEERLKALYDDLLTSGSLLLEQMIEQHPRVSAIYPGAVNTVRVMTTRHGDDVDIIAAAMRFGRRGKTDNFSLDGLVSDVDVQTGVLLTSGIDKKGTVYRTHPLTGVPFAGFEVPLWDDVCKIVRSAARVAQHNDFIGWDVAIREDGPCIVEGNARAGTGLVQAPYAPQRLGRDYVFRPYIDSLSSGRFVPQLAEQPSDFEYKESGEGIAITGYRAQRPVVHVPARIDGKPVIEIGEAAFAESGFVQSIRLPSSVTRLGHGAFRDCRGLRAVFLGENLEVVGRSSFEGCENLRALVLPESIRSIGSRAFSRCSSLTDVTLPYRVRTVRERLFEGDTALRTVTLPAGAREISNAAFGGCTALARVRQAHAKGRARTGYRSLDIRDGLPAALEKLGNAAFRGCESLTSVTIPHGVTKIPARAFEACTSLDDVRLHNGVVALGSRAFAECPALKLLRVPFTCKKFGEGALGSVETITASRTSPAAEYAAAQGIGFRALQLESKDPNTSQMQPLRAAAASGPPFYDVAQLEAAREHFQVRVSDVSRVDNDTVERAPLDLVDGAYTRHNRIPGQARIMLVGGLNARSRQIREARRDGRYDFDAALQHARAVIQQSDLAIGGLATSLARSYPYSDDSGRVDSVGDYQNAPDEYALALRRAGFDAVAAAGEQNYALGVDGVFETLESLNSAGLAHTGLFAASSDRRFELFDIGGIQVSLHSFMVDRARHDKRANFTVRGRRTLFSTAEEKEIRRQLADAKAAGADYSISYCAWEGTTAPTDRDREAASVLAEAGADLIVGSLTRTVQQFATLQTSGGKEVSCLWGSGEFVSDGMRSGDTSHATLVLDVVLEASADGSIESRIRYRPFHVSRFGKDATAVAATIPCSLVSEFPDHAAELDRARYALSGLLDGAIYPAARFDDEPRPVLPKSVGEVERRINAAIDAVAHFEFPEYTRENFGEKRDLDNIVLAEAAERAGMTAHILSDRYHVYERNGKILPFHMHMSSRVSRLDRDATNNKDITRRVLERAGLPIARGILVKRASELDAAFDEIGVPLVVKPEAGSFGRGVRLSIESLDELREAARPLLDSGQNVIVEEMFQGIDLRIAVVDGEARAATFRVPANVVGDGTSTIRELVEEKNERRSSNDYIAHQKIRFTSGIMEFLDKLGLSVDHVPRAGKRVFLHHVANISAGGDSYEVIDEVHPSIKDLAVRTAALFPSALHSGIDILTERLDADLSTQRAIICEVNLNNELPLHTLPVAGPSTPLADIELAAHWESEAREVDLIELASKADERDVSARDLPDVVAQHAIAVEYPAGSPTPLRSAEASLLSAAFSSVGGEEVSGRYDADGFVYISRGGEESVADPSANSVHSRALAAWHAIRLGVSGLLGVPALERRNVDPAGVEDAVGLFVSSGKPWNLHVRGAGTKSTTETVVTEQQLRAVLEAGLAEGREVSLEEIPEPARITVLSRAGEVLAAQLAVPFGVLGDGRSTLERLVREQIRRRNDNPVTSLRRTPWSESELLSRVDGSIDRVPTKGEWLSLGDSPETSDGGMHIGVPATTWPALAAHVERVSELVESCGLFSMTFTLRRDGNVDSWAWNASSSVPRLATFKYPHAGIVYDGFEDHAEFLLSAPARLL